MKYTPIINSERIFYQVYLDVAERTSGFLLLLGFTLEPLLDACNTSPRFVRALLDVSADLKRYLFVLEIGHKLERYTSAITRKTLLEILRATLATMDNPRNLLLETNIDNVLISLLTDDAISGQVLVMNLAGNILLVAA